MKKTILLISLLILGAASIRLLPHHIYNFTPIGAIALFSGVYLRQVKFSWLIPIGIMILSDIALELTRGIGFHQEMPFVYGAFILTYILGRKALSSNPKGSKVALGALSASAIFFILTNFGSWILSPAYTKDLAGLATCYVAAIPFYTPGDLLSSFALNGLLGDLFYSGVLFGSYALVKSSLTVQTPDMSVSK